MAIRINNVKKITLKALFLSLFITENCFSLALTVSPNETLGAFFAFINHGWSAFSEQVTVKSYHFRVEKFKEKNRVNFLCRIWIAWYLPNTSCAVSRRFGSGFSIFFTRSFALSETFGHGSLLKSTTDRMIACATPCSVSSFYKGGRETRFRKSDRKTIRDMHWFLCQQLI